MIDFFKFSFYREVRAKYYEGNKDKVYIRNYRVGYETGNY